MPTRFYSMPRCACPHCGYDATTENTILRCPGLRSGYYWREHKCPNYRCERHYWSGTNTLVDHTSEETITRTYYADAFTHRYQTPEQRRRAKHSNNPIDSLAFHEPYDPNLVDTHVPRRRGRGRPKRYEMPPMSPAERADLRSKLTAIYPPPGDPGHPDYVEPMPAHQPEPGLDAFIEEIAAKVDAAQDEIASAEQKRDEDWLFNLLHPELKEEDTEDIT